MKFWLFTFVCILFNLHGFTQNKQYAIWYFNRNGIDFNYNPAMPISNPATNFGDNAVLCNTDGSIKYRFADNNIYDSNNQIIENGTFFYGSNVSNMHQFINLGRYSVFFHLDSFAIKYSIIDNLPNSGQGLVLADKKSINLVTWKQEGLGGLYIIRSSQCNSYWIIHRKALYYSVYSLNELGEISYSHESEGLFVRDTINVFQSLKFSKSGNLYAIAEKSKIEMGYFNRENGTFSKQSVYSQIELPLGFEFSPNGRFFYYISNNNLYQVPIFNDVPDWINTILISTLTKTGGYDAKLGIDNKIYIINITGKLLSVINNPNEPGVACNFQENSFSLPYFQILNRFPTYPLIETSCSIYSITTNNNCVGILTQFSISNFSDIQSVLWNFGDSQTSTELNPTHTYANAGAYTVTLEVMFTDNSTQTITKTIEIFNKPITITIEHD